MHNSLMHPSAHASSASRKMRVPTPDAPLPKSLSPSLSLSSPTPVLLESCVTSSSPAPMAPASTCRRPSHPHQPMRHVRQPNAAAASQRAAGKPPVGHGISLGVGHRFGFGSSHGLGQLGQLGQLGHGGRSVPVHTHGTEAEAAAATAAHHNAATSSVPWTASFEGGRNCSVSEHDRSDLGRDTVTGGDSGVIHRAARDTPRVMPGSLLEQMVAAGVLALRSMPEAADADALPLSARAAPSMVLVTSGVLCSTDSLVEVGRTLGNEWSWFKRFTRLKHGSQRGARGCRSLSDGRTRRSVTDSSGWILGASLGAGAVRCQLSAVSCQLSAVSCQLSRMGWPCNTRASKRRGCWNDQEA